MENNYQCFQLASAFSKVDWNRFVREVKEGIRCQHLDTIAFVTCLGPYYPDFKMKDECIFSQAFPDRSYSNPRIRVLRTYFKALLEEFIVEQTLQNDPQTRELLLLRGLRGLNCLPQAAQQLKKAKRRLSSPLSDLPDFDHALRLEELSLDLSLRLHQRANVYDFSQLLQRLDASALTQKLRLLCSMLSAGKFSRLASPEDQTGIRQALQAAQEMGPEIEPLTDIFYHLLLLLSGNQQQSFFHRLENLMHDFGPQMPASERINVFALLINYLLYQDRKGESGSLPRAFRVYQEMLVQDLIFGWGAFSINCIRNMLSMGARLGEVAWTREFLHLARGKVPVRHADKLFGYGEAYLDFAEARLSGAKRHLASFDFSDPFYKLAHDFLLLRIYYDAKETEPFHSLHAAMLRHLYRKEEVATDFRQGMKNALKVMLVMFESRAIALGRGDNAPIKDLLNGFEFIAVKEWMFQKLEEL